MQEPTNIDGEPNGLKNANTITMQEPANRHLSLLVMLILIIIGIEAYFAFSLKEKIVNNTSRTPVLRLQEEIKKGQEKIKNEHDRWSRVIDQKGPEAAYQEFKRAYAGLQIGIQHIAGHVFGELLFEKEGARGLATCDSDFGFGCYHGFLEAAIVKEGLAVLPELNRACIDKWGEKGFDCPHGIGHGVLSYLGDNHLDEALNDCSKLSWNGPIGGCATGIFMGYNFKNINHSGIIQTRTLDSKRPYEPCASVAKNFLPACFFEEARWWEKVFKKDYARIGILCDTIQDTAGREACFQGIGNVAASSSNYNLAQATNACKKMPSRVGEILCRSGASWSFFTDPLHRAEAPELCSDLAKAEAAFCVGKSDLVGGTIKPPTL